MNIRHIKYQPAYTAVDSFPDTVDAYLLLVGWLMTGEADAFIDEEKYFLFWLNTFHTGIIIMGHS